MWIPAIQDVSNIHLHLTQLFAAEDDPISPSGIRNQDLLESACTRPHTGSGSSDKYHTVDLKLAALFHSLTKNHPFHNGNKRTALAALLAGLSRNDKRHSTKKLSGPVVRSYMRSLGLHESSTGLTLDEFQDGAGSERMEIRRYMKTMRMLAKT